jgi:two-component system response regulator FixJ
MILVVDDDASLRAAVRRVDRLVFVIDDDAAALDSLLMLLRVSGFDSRGFSSAESFLRSVTAEARGCVISDVRMPGMDGVQLVMRLKAMGNILPVILVTGHADISVAVQAMKSGAAEFIEKPFESELILRLLRGCLEGNDDAVGEHGKRAQVLQRLASLTARERQVLDLMMEGAANKTVALRLGISPRTVEIYRANLMSKMRADSLPELIRMNLSAGPA